ncbi:MAG: dihydrolipoamide acetyltransferase family protein, partial [Candidatus Dormibacteraceae bacterium]
IAYLLAEGEVPPGSEVSHPAVAAEPVAAVAESTPSAVLPAPDDEAPRNRPAASPKARRLAAQLGLDLNQVVGTGPGGAVLESDLAAAAGAAAGSSSEPADPDTSGALWAAMAANMQNSWREVPHFYLTREVDASALVRDRGGLAPEISVGDLVTHRTARVLARHRVVNSGSDVVNIGIAVATDQGLIVPVIHQAHKLSLEEFASQRREVVERARAGRMRAGDMDAATFTVSNLGMFGVDSFQAIVTAGQAGILALGRIADRVVAGEGGPQVRPMVSITLSFDHRLVDGARGAQFLQELTVALEASRGAQD